MIPFCNTAAVGVSANYVEAPTDSEWLNPKIFSLSY